MKVFLSWSGDSSKKVALLLNDWIVQVIQAIEPWISIDIEKGTRWSEEVSNKLEQTKFGVICLTKENLKSDWILFEAGALSKTKDANVCTFLLDVDATDVTPPLSQFQNTQFDKADIQNLVITMNKKLGESGGRSLPEQVLRLAFERWYPDLENRLNEIRNEQKEVEAPNRSERDMLQEVLESVRKIERSLPLNTILGSSYNPIWANSGLPFNSGSGVDPSVFHTSPTSPSFLVKSAEPTQATKPVKKRETS